MKITDYFFDVDYTLVDFGIGHEQALRTLGKKYPPAFVDHFAKVFLTFLEGLRVKDNNWSKVPGGREHFDSVMRLSRELAGRITQHVWSREIWACIARDETHAQLTPAECFDVASLYWESVIAHATVYPDVAPLYAHLASHNSRFHVFTSSDARLKWDAQNSTWIYESKFSNISKMKRVKLVQTEGVNITSVTLGDLDDKPSPLFYKRILDTASQAVGFSLNPQQCAFVGDSFESDVKIPLEQLRLGRGYWLCRGNGFREISESIRQIGTLGEVE
ncbi:MAG: HAD family hydrolase [Patescibacteria group bacterium]|jgi:FMN phosphatase YigB (HAD superfamily)